MSESRPPRVADVVESNRRRFDLVYALLASRDKQALRAFVALVRVVVERRYADEFASPAHDEQRRLKDEFFDELVARDDYLGARYLAATLFFGALSEREVARYQCPAPPDPDAPDEHDAALVERAAWVRFTQRYAEPKFARLYDSALSLGQFVDELVADYWGLVAHDPFARVGRSLDARPAIVSERLCDDGSRRRTIDDSAAARAHAKLTTKLAPSK